jgi:hypothetical protein
MKDAPKTIYLQVCEENECDSEFSEHEGVTWCDEQINDSDIEYTRADLVQPKREWVGLTDRDIEAIWGEDVSLMYSGHYDAIRAIEAKLKEKNT